VRLDHLLSRDTRLTNRSSHSQVDLLLTRRGTRDRTVVEETACVCQQLAGFHFSGVRDS
jgi:hypothetical protein